MQSDVKMANVEDVFSNCSCFNPLTHKPERHSGTSYMFRKKTCVKGLMSLFYNLVFEKKKAMNAVNFFC